MTHSDVATNLVHSPTSLATGLEGACLCHGRPAVGREARKAKETGGVAPRVALNVLRPIVRHVLGFASASRPDLVPWKGLDDEGRVPLIATDGWIEDVSCWLGDPALGLTALTQLERGTGDVVEFGAECAATVGDALCFVARYAGVFSDAANFHVHANGRFALLSLVSSVSLGRVLRDFQAGSLAMAAQSWSGLDTGWALWFSGKEPGHASMYRAMLPGVDVEFEAPFDALVLPAQRLDAPLPARNPKLHGLLSRYAERLASEFSASYSIAGTVRGLLAELLPQGDCTMEIVAGKLGLSPRTVARRLQQQGLEFSTVLGDFRREKAIDYLERTDLSPYAISQLLGYASTSAFSRAFSRWLGQSPVGYRQSARRGRPPAVSYVSGLRGAR